VLHEVRIFVNQKTCNALLLIRDLSHGRAADDGAAASRYVWALSKWMARRGQADVQERKSEHGNSK